MVLSLRNLSITFLIAASIGLSGWSIFLSTARHASNFAQPSNEPDAFIEKFSATVFNEEGKPALKVESPLMTHFYRDDTTLLTKPHVTIYRQSPEPWHIRANYATATFGTEEITFNENVVIHHLADSDNPLTTMHTSSLTVLPHQQLAKTNEAIIMRQPEAMVHAVGMLANWKEGTVKLLSHAREEYVPRS